MKLRMAEPQRQESWASTKMLNEEFDTKALAENTTQKKNFQTNKHFSLVEARISTFQKCKQSLLMPFERIEEIKKVKKPQPSTNRPM